MPPGKAECTFEVLLDDVEVLGEPDFDSEVLLTLGKGERVTGTCSRVGDLPWLRLSRSTAETHPQGRLLAQGAWVLIEERGAPAGRERQLARAPAELGWCPAAGEAKEGRAEIFEVVGRNGLHVIALGEDGNNSFGVLEVGSLIKAARPDTARRRMEYVLLTGSGPEHGFVSTDPRGGSSLERVSLGALGVQAAAAEEEEGKEEEAAAPPEEEAAAPAPAPAPAQDAARVREAIRHYGRNFMATDDDAPQSSSKREVSHRQIVAVSSKAADGVRPTGLRLRRQSAWPQARPQARRASRTASSGAEAAPRAEAATGEDLARGRAGEGGVVDDAREDKVWQELAGDLVSSATTRTPSDDLGSEEESEGEPGVHCSCCGLPMGMAWYTRSDGEHPAHGECLAQEVLRGLREEEEALRREAGRRRARRREEYGIGWNASRIPANSGPIQKLSGCIAPNGLCALALAPDNEVTIVPTVSPAAAVNLEYLSVALKVRRDEDREPLFSLDPLEMGPSSMQVKRFEPFWLKSTRVGDVLFEADYHLKELSMGEYEQPVVGMNSCMDQEDFFQQGDWEAREWFVVRRAEVMMSEDGVLLPICKMGVEAREQGVNKDGMLEDSRVTRPDHPLVQYAESFTHFFDLIAERKSVIYHLRELAKASILAKYLLMSDVRLDSLWFDLFETRDQPCILEIPQLWNERGYSQIQVDNGQVLQDSTTERCARAMYGGVQFGLNKFRMGPGASAGLHARTVLGATPGRSGRLMSGAVAARRGFMPMAGHLGAPRFSPMAGVSSVAGLGPAGLRAGVARGVDLGLNKFPLNQTRVATHVKALAWGEDVCGCVSFGDKFWEQLEGGADGSVFSEDHRDFLKRIFNPCLSDRHTEGEKFAPPDGERGYCGKLRNLLQEEQEVRRRRKAHFLSREFAPEDAGPLFPRWANDFALRQGRKASQTPGGHLQARPDYLEEAGRECPEAARLRRLMLRSPPAFERSTEDGLTYRIYRLGSLEFRTTLEPGGREEVGAIFSRRATQDSAAIGRKAEVLHTELVERVTQYVENDPARVGRRACRFYVVLETKEGNLISTEKLLDGRVSWDENPADLDDRNSLARVVRTAEGLSSAKGRCFSLGTLMHFKASHQRGLCSRKFCRRYADKLFDRVAGEPADGMAHPRS